MCRRLVWHTHTLLYRKQGVSLYDPVLCFMIHTDAARMGQDERGSSEWTTQRERERENPVGVDEAFSDCKKKKEVREEGGQHKKEVKIQSDQMSHFAVYPTLNSALIGQLPATLRVTSLLIGRHWDCGPGRLPDSCLKDINTSSPPLSLSV